MAPGLDRPVTAVGAARRQRIGSHRHRPELDHRRETARARRRVTGRRPARLPRSQRTRLAEVRRLAIADAKGRRVDAATGIVAMVLFVVGFLLPGAPPKADDPIQKITTFFVDHRGDILASDALIALAAVFFLWWLGSLRGYLRAAEGGEGRLSAAAFAGGLLGVTLTVA